jgi:hypothetical protein
MFQQISKTFAAGEIRRMYVLPSARRAGVATAILIRLEQEATCRATLAICPRL